MIDICPIVLSGGVIIIHATFIAVDVLCHTVETSSPEKLQEGQQAQLTGRTIFIQPISFTLSCQAPLLHIVARHRD